MAISDTTEETSTKTFSDHLTSDSWNNEANSSADLSTSMLHHCFENGSMLVPFSYFPPGPNGTYHIPPNITSMGSEKNSSLLMNSEVRNDFTLLMNYILLAKKFMHAKYIIIY